MRVSTKGRYGLRAMFELAQCFGERPVLMSTIAAKQDLTRKHLHALLTSLKSAGLVRSVRGPGGGFVLTRSPDQIRLSEILHALEGPLSLVHCVADRRSCDRANRCAARGVWQELSGAIEEVLDNITLADMIAPDGKRCFRPRGRAKERGSTKRKGRNVRPSGVTSRSQAQETAL